MEEMEAMESGGGGRAQRGAGRKLRDGSCHRGCHTANDPGSVGSSGVRGCVCGGMARHRRAQVAVRVWHTGLWGVPEQARGGAGDGVGHSGGGGRALDRFSSLA